MSIMLDEANAYERGMDDDLTLAKRLCWDSYEWDGVDSDCVAKDEDDAWDYAGNLRLSGGLHRPGARPARSGTQGGKRMSKAIRYVECAHCGETVGSYYVTCPYCGYRLVDAKQAVMMGLSW